MAEPHPQVFVIGRKLRSWYRAIGPTGDIWIEDRNPDEVVKQAAAAPEEYQPVRLQRVTYYEAHTGWEEWSPDE